MRDEKETWTITDEEFDKSTLEDLKFVFSQSEKLLIENLKSLELLLTRANYITGAIIALATLSIGLALSQWNSSKIIDHFVLVLGTFTLYLIYMLIKLIKVIKPINVYYTGSKPRDMLVKSLYEPYYDKENTRLKELIWSEIKSYQVRIELMHDVVENETKRFNHVIDNLGYFPLIIVAAIIIDVVLHKVIH